MPLINITALDYCVFKGTSQTLACVWHFLRIKWKWRKHEFLGNHIYTIPSSVSHYRLSLGWDPLARSQNVTHSFIQLIDDSNKRPGVFSPPNN